MNSLFYYYYKIWFLTYTIDSSTTRKRWNQINRAWFTSWSHLISKPRSKELLAACGRVPLFASDKGLGLEAEALLKNELLHLRFSKSFKKLQETIKVYFNKGVYVNLLTI